MHIKATILYYVIGAASESDIAARYVYSCDTIETRVTLKEIGHPQLSAPLETDNTISCRILTKQLLL